MATPSKRAGAVRPLLLNLPRRYRARRRSLGRLVRDQAADLTDGRLMNRLPDEFSIQRDHARGPAEGLSPGMPPLAAYLSDAETRQAIAYLRSIASPAFRPEMAKPLVSAPHAPRQPILFSHLIHAGSFQIPCQYCHADARRSSTPEYPRSSAAWLSQDHRSPGQSRDREDPRLRTARPADSVGQNLQGSRIRLFPAPTSRALWTRVSDLSRPDRANAGRRRGHGTQAKRRPATPRRFPTDSPCADDGMVRRVSP